jgi:hypothetical protein
VSTCLECGFDYESLGSGEVPTALTRTAERFQAVLSRRQNVDVLRRRTRPDVWSALEYACHSRDVMLVQRERLYLTLVEDTPSFARMYRDERALLARYNAQDPTVVSVQLGVAAQLVAQAFADLNETDWRRRLVYNFPEPRERDVVWLAAHTVHEVRHHLGDFTAVMAAHAPRETPQT